VSLERRLSAISHTPVAKAKTTPVASKQVAGAKTSAAPLKKDGTPDKRFKANHVAAFGSLKKNGAPDMRYKANKKHS
jgi:hypothetical protein